MNIIDNLLKKWRHTLDIVLIEQVENTVGKLYRSVFDHWRHMWSAYNWD